jgi:chromosome transmission fidelity protein 4
MTGRSRFVAIFYHVCAPLADQTQKLGYTLLDAVSNRTIATGSASCISSGGSLAWAGFDNDGSLMTLDTKGMLSMLVCAGSNSTGSALVWEWMPMLDTIGLRKSADDSHWPISVVDGKLVCVPLKGGTKYPDATRRPVTTALGLRLPLARGTLTKGYVWAYLCSLPEWIGFAACLLTFFVSICTTQQWKCFGRALCTGRS